MARTGSIIPRSVLPLGVLLLVALAWFFWGERAGRRRVDLSLGGPLWPFAAEQAIRLELQHPSAGKIVLVRDLPTLPWRLEGDVQDWVDPESSANLVASIWEETGGPVLPDESGEPLDWPSLGLTGPSAVRLRVRSERHEEAELTLGFLNPLLERHYAQGAGRDGVFTVSTRLARLLSSLPDGVRLLTLFPPFTPVEAETVQVRPAGARVADVFVRDAGGAWWLRGPVNDPQRLGGLFTDYDRFYRDRRREVGDEIWWRAQDRKLNDLLFQAGTTSVRLWGLRHAPPETLRDAGLAPLPLALRVALRNHAAPLRALFGTPGKLGETPVLRGGQPHVVVVTGEASAAAASPLAEFLDVDALPVELARADSFVLRRPGLPSARAWREGEKWRAQAPLRPDIQTKPDDILADLIHHFDHLAIVGPLPPVLPRGKPGTHPLQDLYGTELVIWAAPTPLRLEIGMLADGSGAALYCPDDGKLLRVSRDIIVSIRSFLMALGI